MISEHPMTYKMPESKMGVLPTTTRAYAIQIMLAPRRMEKAVRDTSLALLFCTISPNCQNKKLDSASTKITKKMLMMSLERLERLPRGLKSMFTASSTSLVICFLWTQRKMSFSAIVIILTWITSASILAMGIVLQNKMTIKTTT